jgi:cytochrome c oxidase subunit 2
MSDQVDALYAFLVIVSAIMTGIIFVSIFLFAIKYRRRSESEIPQPIHGGLLLETAWSVGPLLIMLVMFAWGAQVFFQNYVAPAGAMEIYVVGKQWMWKLQHPEGQREINELHVPTGRPIKLVMTTEDVIHSFYIPAFRVKKDVVPGYYNSIWFQATKPGKYHLFCAEYCGNQHSGMIGWVYVMEPPAYEAWLTGPGGSESMVSQGEKMFQQRGCASCHAPSSGTARCPNLNGIYGNPVLLRGGQQTIANEAYIRESILFPEAKIVAGYEPIMPTFEGQISEEEVLQLIAYVKSIGGARRTPGEVPGNAQEKPGGAKK